MTFIHEPNDQPDPLPPVRHLVLQSLDTAISTWFTLLPERLGDGYRIEEDQEPLTPERVYLRRRHHIDGEWGPWWGFVGQWHEDGWIVDPVDVPTDRHPGRMYFLWDDEEGFMHWTQLEG